jgi:hypothetical protein
MVNAYRNRQTEVDHALCAMLHTCSVPFSNLGRKIIIFLFVDVNVNASASPAAKYSWGRTSTTSTKLIGSNGIDYLGVYTCDKLLPWSTVELLLLSKSKCLHDNVKVTSAEHAGIA